MTSLERATKIASALKKAPKDIDIGMVQTNIDEAVETALRDFRLKASDAIRKKMSECPCVDDARDVIMKLKLE